MQTVYPTARSALNLVELGAGRNLTSLKVELRQAACTWGYLLFYDCTSRDKQPCYWCLFWPLEQFFAGQEDRLNPSEPEKAFTIWAYTLSGVQALEVFLRLVGQNILAARGNPLMRRSSIKAWGAKWEGLSKTLQQPEGYLLACKCSTYSINKGIWNRVVQGDSMSLGVSLKGSMALEDRQYRGLNNYQTILGFLIVIIV